MKRDGETLHCTRDEADRMQAEGTIPEGVRFLCVPTQTDTDRAKEQP